MLWMDHGMGWAWLGMALTWIVPFLLIVGLARALAVLIATGPADSGRGGRGVRYAPIPIDRDDHGKQRRNQQS